MGLARKKKLVKALLIAALGFACLACGSASSQEEDLPLAPLGYGAADTWHLPGAPSSSQIARAGLRFEVIEHFPTVQDKDWRKGEPLVSFPSLAREKSKEVCKNGQTLVVFLVNWNVLPFRTKSDLWFAEVLNEALSVYDPACTWLEPIVEPDEGDVQKARRWTQWAADAWPGKVLLPAAGAHWPIRRDFVDWHPSSPRDLLNFLESPPPGFLVVTDGGSFVSPPSVFGEYEVLSRRALEAGVPVIFYTDRWQGDHASVLAEIQKGTK